VAYNEAKKFLETLAENPKDPEANAKVGRYRCFIKGDWKSGLPMLAKGSDAALQALATKELAGAKGADEQVSVGDGWWTLGESLTGVAKAQTQMHARTWYSQALPALKGLSKARVEKRVQSGPSAAVASKVDPAVKEAVTNGLKWLAKQQRADGSWSFATPPNPGELNAAGTATYMALLAYMRAGHTHRAGDFKTEVDKGLTFAMGLIKPTKDGADMRDGQDMYTHAIGTTMLCEAYARTKDMRLLKPAQQAVSYILWAQEPKSGGWRYQPRKGADTSVMGWQMVALKAAKDAGFHVPADTYTKAGAYLDSVQIGGGNGYKYDVGAKNAGSASVTAVGLLCRLYCGADRTNKGLITGVKTVGDRGIIDDLYFNYYAAYLMKEWGGEEWPAWEKAMQEQVLKRQDKDGSWMHFHGHISAKCGRVGKTMVALWMLETAYPKR
jgi:hypothetical protein